MGKGGRVLAEEVSVLPQWNLPSIDLNVSSAVSERRKGHR